MKAILVMFDSLNRNYLPPYGKTELHAPNFARLAEQTVTFENAYVCSMPCMPARRDLHTARPNFFHTPWSSLQPWDDSIPEMLKQAGISTHMMTDHYHYYEDGGCGYLQRYSTWQAIRGQEGDHWMGQADPVVPPENVNPNGWDQDWLNRQFIQKETDFPQHRTFEAGLEFLERNHDSENPWFLQIETFDPHEPFYAPASAQDLYDHAGEAPVFDWPAYRDVCETEEEQARLIDNYKALLSFCDKQLGRVLDFMDTHQMWEDTLLIVGTDHGFLLGEHNRWAKNVPTLWNEIARTPFFVWDPRCGKKGERRTALVQPMLDIGPTLLEAFGLETTPDMTGHDLSATVDTDTPVRETAAFGYFGYPVNITDGRYVYMRNAADPEAPFFQHTWMPAPMRDRFQPEWFSGVELGDPLPFSKGVPVPRIPVGPRGGTVPEWSDLLFDLQADPAQGEAVEDEETKARLTEALTAEMRRAHAPDELFVRFGLS